VQRIFDQSPAGIVLGPREVAPVEADAGGEGQCRSQVELVLGGDAVGFLDTGLLRLGLARGEGLLPLDMLVAAVVGGNAQPVDIADRSVELRRSAPGGVGIIAVEGARHGLGGLAAIVEGAQQVVEPVAIDAGLERRPVPQRGGREEIEAVDVPVRPRPVALRGGGIGHMERRVLGAFLPGIADRVFVGGIGREAQLGVHAPVGRAREIAVAAVLGRSGAGFVAAGKIPVIGEIAGIAGLRVPLVLPGAEQCEEIVAGVFPLAPEIEGAARFRFDRFDRLAGDEVDGTAHRSRSVEHRGIALGHLHLGDIGSEEAAVVEPPVGRQVDADAVDRERHLIAIEAAHVDQSLVARSAAVR